MDCCSAREGTGEIMPPQIRSVAALAATLLTSTALAAEIVVGRDSSPTVITEFRTFSVNGSTIAQTGSVQPFGPSFRGGVRVAMGDVNHNGTREVIGATGPDANVVSNTNTFDSTPGSTNYSTFPYVNFHGGLYIAAGNVNGNGFDDMVIGPGPGMSPLVRVFDGGTTTFIHAFNAFDPQYAGGVRVAAGDLTGDGLADIFCATGPGAPGQIKVFNGVSLAVERNFFPFGPASPAACSWRRAISRVTGARTSSRPRIRIPMASRWCACSMVSHSSSWRLSTRSTPRSPAACAWRWRT
jgi:hypothetical protein